MRSSRATKTSEDVQRSGLYVNDCCDQELVFGEGDTFWRCPRCSGLCVWELEDEVAEEMELEQVA